MATQKFVVLTQQRSGSIWFATILRNNPSIKLLGEIFQDPKSKRHDVDIYDGDSDIRVFLMEKLEGEDPGLVGFKLMYDQVKMYPDVINLLREMNVKVIRLKRQNYLDIWVSKLVAQKNKLWASRSKNNSLDKINLDINTIVSDISEIENISNNLDDIALNFESIEVVYEELVLDIEIINDAYNFLGVEKNEVIDEGRTKKIIKSKDSVVSNWAEVCDKLSKTKYSNLL